MMNDEGIPLVQCVTPRTEKAMPSAFPEEPFLGLDDVEAHTTRLLGTKPSASMKSSAKRFYPGDILYSRLRPYLNKVWLADRSGLCSSEFIVLPSNEHLDGGFLKYRLSAMDFVSFANSLNAGDRPRVDFDQISSFCIPPFSLARQRRIVAKIEELFSELEAGEESLRLARRQLATYRQSLLKQAFEGKLTQTWRTQNPDKLESPAQLLSRIQSARTAKGLRPSKAPLEVVDRTREKLPAIPQAWHWLRLEHLAVIGTGMSVSQARTYNDPVEVPYLRVANVQRGRLDLAEMRTMLVERSRLEELRVKTGDVLFNEGGDRDKLGRGWVWSGRIEPCVTQNHVFRASALSTSITAPEFISHWGNAFGQDFFNLTGKQTTNLASISKGTLSSLPVPVPPVQEQQEILRLLNEQFEAIERNERELDAALQRSEALRQAILKKAFTGRLVPQDPADEPATELLARIRAEREEARKFPTTKAAGKQTMHRKR